MEEHQRSLREEAEKSGRQVRPEHTQEASISFVTALRIYGEMS